MVSRQTRIVPREVWEEHGVESVVSIWINGKWKVQEVGLVLPPEIAAEYLEADE